MPNSDASIAVTGVTGTLGQYVARLIHDSGASQRMLARTPDKAPKLSGAAVFEADYAAGPAVRRALTGVRTLFMVSLPEAPDRIEHHRTFIDSARGADVEHVVYTSFLGAAPDATFTLARDHHVTEEYIKRSGMDYTFLRDNLYMDLLPEFADSDGVISGPAGAGRVSIVARVDVARTATAALLDPTVHKGKTYNLTGPAALTLTEIADTLSQSFKRPIRYRAETIDEAYRSRSKWNAPAWQNDAWVSTYTAIANGDLALVSDDVRAVTGRAPISLAEFRSNPAAISS